MREIKEYVEYKISGRKVKKLKGRKGLRRKSVIRKCPPNEG